MAGNSSTARLDVRSKIIESGQKERLKILLKERLVECGWRDAIKDEVRPPCRPATPAR